MSGPIVLAKRTLYKESSKPDCYGFFQLLDSRCLVSWLGFWPKCYGNAGFPKILFYTAFFPLALLLHVPVPSVKTCLQ